MIDKYYKTKYELEGYKFHKVHNDTYNYIALTKNFVKLIFYIHDKSITKKDQKFYLKKYKKIISNFKKLDSNYYVIKEIWIKQNGQELVIITL